MDYEEADLATREVSKQNTWKDRTTQEEGDRRTLRDNRGRDRDHDRRPRRFNVYTRLNTSRSEIFAECVNAEFRDVRRSEPFVLKEGQQPSKRYYRYHHSNGHDTNDSMALKDDIEELIQRGKLSQYVKNPPPEEGGHKQGRRGRSPRHSPRRDHRERSPQRSHRKGKAIVNEVSKKVGEGIDSEEEPDTRRSRGRKVAMVILGGDMIEGGETNKSVKRRWKEIMNVASSSTVGAIPSRLALLF